jgi:DeoR family fructose operon transcriptional repressor
MLAEFCLALAMVGARGNSLENGLTTTDPGVTDLKRTVMRQARRKVFVGSHTKFGLSSSAASLALMSWTYLSPAAPDAHTAGRYQAAGPQVIRAFLSR